jgi:hypothetical protein
MLYGWSVLMSQLSLDGVRSRAIDTSVMSPRMIVKDFSVVGGRRREEGRDQGGRLIQTSRKEMEVTNGEVTNSKTSSLGLTWIILVTISWTAALIAVMLPDIAITLSFVVGKNSPFCETFILAPVAWFNWLITDPPRPIIDPAIADGQRSFRR